MKNKSINNKHSLDFKDYFTHCIQKFQMVVDKGYRDYKIDLIQLGKFLQLIVTNLEKMEIVNINIYPCNSHTNKTKRK